MNHRKYLQGQTHLWLALTTAKGQWFGMGVHRKGTRQQFWFGNGTNWPNFKFLGGYRDLGMRDWVLEI